MPAKTTVPHISATEPDPVRVYIGLSEKFTIWGTDLNKNIVLCASDIGIEVAGIDISVNESSSNSDKRLSAIVKAGEKTPLDKRDIELEISIKDTSGAIVVSAGVLIVS